MKNFFIDFPADLFNFSIAHDEYSSVYIFMIMVVSFSFQFQTLKLSLKINIKNSKNKRRVKKLSKQSDK